jgi:hypothetical protein
MVKHERDLDFILEEEIKHRIEREIYIKEDEPRMGSSGKSNLSYLVRDESIKRKERKKYSRVYSFKH